VRALRRTLADAPDEAIVRAFVNDEPWNRTSVGYLAHGAALRPACMSRINPDPTLVLHCAPQSGTFLRPRPGRLLVEHGEAHDAETAAAHERLKQAVQDAIAQSGYRGGSNMGSVGPMTIWEWESANVDVVEVVAAAGAAVAKLNPGTWHATSEVG